MSDILRCSDNKYKSKSECIFFNREISSSTIASLVSILGYQEGLMKDVYIPSTPSGTVTAIALHLFYKERKEFIYWLEFILEKEK